MGALDKIKNAKKSNWLTEGLNKKEVEEIVNLARISGRIENKRKSLNMTQKEFAEFMGVTQGMVSKWESREYNFSINTLYDICKKLELNLNIDIREDSVSYDYCARADFSEWKISKFGINNTGIISKQDNDGDGVAIA